MGELNLNFAAILTRSKPLDRVILVSFESPLFFLIEIKGPLHPSNILAQSIIETVSKMREQNFEEAVRQTNDVLAKAVEEGQTEWLQNISAIIALVSGNKIHLTSVGNAACFLFREGKEIEVTKEQPEVAQPLKAFPHILSGGLQGNDKIIIGNPAFFSYFSLDFLTQTLFRGPLSETAPLLNRSLNKDKIRGARGLVLELTKESAAPLILYSDEVIKRETPNETLQLLAAAGKKLSGLGHATVKTIRRTFFLPRHFVGVKIKRTVAKTALFKRFKSINFSKTQKQITLLIVSLICLLALAGLVGGTMWKRAQTMTSQEAKKLIVQAEDKNRQASILLSQGDKQGAEKLLKETLSLIAPISNKSANNLREKVNFQLDKLYNIFRPKPSEIFDFGKHFEKPDVSHLAMVKGVSFSVDHQNNKLYQGEKSPVSLPQYSGKFVTLGYQSIENILLIYQDLEGIFEYKIDEEKLEKASVVFTEKWKKATVLATYFTNIYLYNPDEAQIYKYEKTAAGYSKPLAYVNKEKVDLRGTISIALDGFVYALKEDGTILKLLGGRPVSDFAVKEIPQPIKIFTWAEIPNLYVLEKNRILELDKNGKYLRMFVFELKDVKDFWVNYKNKKIYILSENKVFEIKM